MDKNQLDGLLALKLVADTGNFSSAAKSLSVSASAVSQMIKNLEKRMGITLLARTTRRIHLTEAGEAFMSEVAPAVEQILSAMEHIKSIADKPSGTLRINSIRSIFPSFLSPLIVSFIEKYPDITVDLYFEDNKADIVGRGFDCGIGLSDILAQDMVAIKLMGPVKFVTAAAPGYLQKKGRPKTPGDLVDHNCILMRLHNWYYDHWEFIQNGKEIKVKVGGSLIINDSTLMLRAACDGAGVVFNTYKVLKPLVDEGKLEFLLTDYMTESEGIYLYYPSVSQVLPKLRAFIDHIRPSINQKAGVDV